MARDTRAAGDTLDSLTRIVRVKEHLWSTLEDEVAVLNLASGVYYGLDPVGAFIWGLLHQPTALGEIVDAVHARYPDVAQATVDGDVREFVLELAGQNLIEFDV